MSRYFDEIREGLQQLYQRFEDDFFDAEGYIEDPGQFDSYYWDRLAKNKNLTPDMIMIHSESPCGRWHGEPCNMFEECDYGKWADGLGHKWCKLSKNPAFIPALTEAIEEGGYYLLHLEDRIDYQNLSRNPDLNQEIIDKYYDELDWDYVCSEAKLSIKLIDRYLKLGKNDDRKYIKWSKLSANPHLNIKMLEKYAEYWKYSILKENSAVPSCFIDRNQKKL